MKARKWGRIINTASAHSLVALPFKAAYVSAKHGRRVYPLPGAIRSPPDDLTGKIDPFGRRRMMAAFRHACSKAAIPVSATSGRPLCADCVDKISLVKAAVR